MCETENNNQSEKHTSHCHVNHSSNTAPVFSCPASATTDEVHSDVREINVNECAYDKIQYNTTTFTVLAADNVTTLTCNVRYTALHDSSLVYSEEPFAVFNDSVADDTVHAGSKRGEQSGKYTITYLPNALAALDRL